MQYTTLQDAADHDELQILDFDEGSTEIWYQRPELFGRVAGFAKDPDIEIDINDLSKTHILLGSVCEADPERLYGLLQGERWSPNGEARDLIRSKGLRHTSMSVGDIVVNYQGTHIVDSVGFKTLG